MAFPYDFEFEVLMPFSYRIFVIVVVFFVLLGSACSRDNSSAAAPPATVAAASISIPTTAKPAAPAAKADAKAMAAAAAQNKPDSEGYRELDWLEMMPDGDLEALKNPPPVNHDGSMRAQQNGSTKTMPILNGQKVKLPGYVVPVETNDSGEMTEFFFVPYFGACIHVPPPPPNQILYVRLKKGVKQPEIWDPYWVKGTIKIESFANDTAATAYTMDADVLMPYQ
jgi:hypothetical protein